MKYTNICIYVNISRHTVFDTPHQRVRTSMSSSRCAVTISLNACLVVCRMRADRASLWRKYALVTSDSPPRPAFFGDAAACGSGGSAGGGIPVADLGGKRTAPLMVINFPLMHVSHHFDLPREMWLRRWAIPASLLAGYLFAPLLESLPYASDASSLWLTTSFEWRLLAVALLLASIELFGVVSVGDAAGAPVLVKHARLAAWEPRGLILAAVAAGHAIRAGVQWQDAASAAIPLAGPILAALLAWRIAGGIIARLIGGEKATWDAAQPSLDSLTATDAQLTNEAPLVDAAAVETEPNEVQDSVAPSAEPEPDTAAPPADADAPSEPLLPTVPDAIDAQPVAVRSQGPSHWLTAVVGLVDAARLCLLLFILPSVVCMFFIEWDSLGRFIELKAALVEFSVYHLVLGSVHHHCH